MLEGLNRYIGALLAALTAAAIIGLVGMYEFMGRMDQRLTALESAQERQLRVNDSMADSVSRLARIVDVLEDRQSRQHREDG